jgi:hypothetical protein
MKASRGAGLSSILAVLVLTLTLAACGGGASTSAPSASPSLSVAPSPKALTEAEQVEAFLLAVKPIWTKVRPINIQSNKLTTSRVLNGSQSMRDASAKTMKKLARQLENLQIDFNLVEVPPAMKKAARHYTSYLANDRLSMTTVASSLHAHGLQMANSYMATANRAVDKSTADLQMWELEVRTQARKLGVKVPWKWRD